LALILKRKRKDAKMPTNLDYMLLGLGMAIQAPFVITNLATFGYDENCDARITVLKGDPVQQIEKISQEIPEYYGQSSKYNVTSSIKHSYERGDYWDYLLDEKHQDVNKKFTRLHFHISPNHDHPATHQDISGKEFICIKEEKSAVETCDVKQYRGTGVISIKSENKMDSLLKDVEKHLGTTNTQEQ
jgi:hypothetical protein